MAICLAEADLLNLAAFTLGVWVFLELFEREPPMLRDLVVKGSVMMFASPGVGDVVHCHAPSAKAQLCPSFAVE